MNKNYFRFKYFSINDSNCGMKICTDSVLFGAWLTVNNNINKILDIGAGSGLISLMLAQKSDAYITAVEICKDAAYCAEENFKQSKWNDRLKIINISLEDFVNKTNETFEMIVCNPPWFNSIKPSDEKRQNARHRESLNYETLLFSVKKLLTPNGDFFAVLPLFEKDVFCKFALINELYLNKETIIHTRQNKKPKRVFLKFSFTRQIKQSNYIKIYDDNGDYSSVYKEITKDYYI